jgi:hypothetical protein
MSFRSKVLIECRPCSILTDGSRLFARTRQYGAQREPRTKTLQRRGYSRRSGAAAHWHYCQLLSRQRRWNWLRSVSLCWCLAHSGSRLLLRPNRDSLPDERPPDSCFGIEHHGNTGGNIKQQKCWRRMAHYGASSEGGPGLSGGSSEVIMRRRAVTLLVTNNPAHTSGHRRSRGPTPHL